MHDVFDYFGLLYNLNRIYDNYTIMPFENMKWYHNIIMGCPKEKARQ